jgi:hypothetical protein
MGSTAAKTTAPKTHRKNSIGDFLVDMIDAEAMREYLSAAKISADKVDPSSEPEALGVALTLYLRETVSEDDLCKCAKCGGEGPASTPGCVFCGIAGDVGDDPTSIETLATVVEAAESSKKKTKKDIPPKAEKAEAEMQTTTVTALVLAGKGKGKTAKGSKEIAVDEARPIFAITDLDEAVGRVIKLKSMTSISLWALGDELRQINEKQLWKLRTVKGKAAYTSFDQFCDLEAKISHTYAYSLIGISTRFNEEEVKEFGTSKLTLMLKVADEDLPKVREIAKTSSKRALAQAVAEVVVERGRGAKKSAVGEMKSAAGKKSAKAKAAKSKAHDKITVATIEGTKRIKLYAKPESIRNIDWKALKRAKTTDASPFGKWELTNEVTVFLSVVKTDDGLEIIANVRRDASE